ncbi:hypothetical protein ACJBU6_03132 [Exserohilum turcicum]
MPMIAMPLSVNNLIPQESVAIERRDFSVTQLFRDFFKREPLIEAIPRAAAPEASVEEEEDDNVDAVGILEGRSSTRPVKNKPGGPTKRAIKGGGGGPTKRAIKGGGGGPTKRAIKGAGGGPGKRFTESLDVQSEEADIKA